MKRASKFGPRYGMKRFAEGGEMTDEERYGKVGAEIRRLDPEAYKNRPKTAEGNLKLLKELRERSKKTPARQASPEEFSANMNARLGSEDKILPDNFVKPVRLRGSVPDLEDKPKAFKTSKDTAREMYSDISKFPKSDSVYEALAKGRKPGYRATPGYKKGGSVKSSASKRADGIAKKGKTRGRFV